MLEVGIISLIDNIEWINIMFVQHNKIGDIRIYFDLRLNKECKHDPFTTPFTKEMLENIAR